MTTKPDTDQGREAALKAVNETILLIVAVILIGYTLLLNFSNAKSVHVFLDCTVSMILWACTLLIRSISTMVRAYLFSAASERVVAKLKKDLFNHLIEQASCFHHPTLCHQSS